MTERTTTFRFEAAMTSASYIPRPVTGQTLRRICSVRKVML